MEDRKRPASGNADDLAPPSKRQAVNGGGSKAKDDAGDAKEETWIEEYQKGAIYRQMLEYKREKATLEQRLEIIETKAAEHDDHIRVIDAWWNQLLEEIELLVDGTISTRSDSAEPLLPTGLQFKDSKIFQHHLAEKGKSLKSRLESLLRRIASGRGDVKPDMNELETQIKLLLASQKDYGIKLERFKSEKESLSEQLDRATLRYIKAEKKLDRARSAQVQKLEQQALAHATNRPAVVENENGADPSETNADYEALQLQCQEAAIAVSKQQEQLEAALSDIKRLQEENSVFKTRKEVITEEEYARTEVFKLFKGQNEDLIKRINHLEATNKQLREEAEKYQAERTHFRTQIEQEAQALAGELEDQIQAKEQDLTRIRSARDELVADQSMRKASQEQKREALEHQKELVSAKEDHVRKLESELERLKPSEDAAPVPRDLESLSLDELRQKHLKLEKDYEAINKELPSIEKAYKKTMVLAQKKVMDFTALEERVAILTAEKAKADQKYFAAHKDMDVRKGEIRALRLQNGKSSEIIAQLKDVEAQNRTLLSNLEKQLSDLKQSNVSVMAENKRLELLSTEVNRRAEATKAQILELTALVKFKDAANAAARERALALEVEVEKLKARTDHIQKDRDTWKAKSLSNSSDEEEMLREIVLCSVCRTNFKNSILKTCGHVFCSECLDNRISNRMRKCPACNKSFDKVDVMAAHLSV